MLVDYLKSELLQGHDYRGYSTAVNRNLPSGNEINHAIAIIDEYLKPEWAEDKPTKNSAFKYSSAEDMCDRSMDGTHMVMTWGYRENDGKLSICRKYDDIHTLSIVHKSNLYSLYKDNILIKDDIE